MNVAEFFILLGVKGDSSAKKAVTGVDKAMKDVKTTSLETKAAIIAVIYGFEQMMSQSAKAGTALYEFSNFTGLSAKELQKWQYAGRQFGVEADEVAGSIKSVQNAMTEMLLGHGAPSGLGILANTIGIDPAKFRDTFYMMEKLQEFAKIAAPDVGNQVIKSFGPSEKIIAAMRKNAFNPEAFSKATVYTDRQAESLANINAQWSNLGDKVQKAFGRFNLEHGGQMVKDLTKITTEVIKLAEAMMKLSTQVRFFEFLAKTLAAIADSITTVTAFMVIFGDKKEREQLADYFDKSQNPEDKKKIDDKMAAINKAAVDAYNRAHPDSFAKSAAVPTVKSKTVEIKKGDVNFNQSLHFQHDGKDAQKTGTDVRGAVNGAMRQLTAQGQEN